MASYTENSLPVRETYIVGEQITKIINIPRLWMCPPRRVVDPFHSWVYLALELILKADPHFKRIK
jgi:hypothetical protein